MQKLKTFVVIAGILLLVAAVFGGAFYLSSGYLARNDKTGPVPCYGPRASHNLDIRNGQFASIHTDATLCDTLTVRNLDDATRLIAFGHHVSHKSYDGVTEKQLQKGESFTITLNEAGTFTIHDHLDAEVEGTFTVSR